MKGTPLVCMTVFVTRDVGYYCSLWIPRDSTALKRSGSYTRRRWDDDVKNSDGSSLTNRTPSYQRRLASANSQTSIHLFRPPSDRMCWCHRSSFVSQHILFTGFTVAVAPSPSQSVLHDCTCTVRLLGCTVQNAPLRRLLNKSYSQGCLWHKAETWTCAELTSNALVLAVSHIL